MDDIEAQAAAEHAANHKTILNGAKAAREVGKTRERTFAIGEGLLAMRSEVLIAMGKDPRLNDRTVLKSAKYRTTMSRALKTYPDYTLSTVFKNDSTRLAYLFCAEYRPQIEAAFADAELREPGSTVRIVNPERIKAKFKALTEPPKEKRQSQAAAQAEAEAQERDALNKRLVDEAIDWKRKYDELKIEYDRLWEETRPKAALSAPAKIKKTKGRKLVEKAVKKALDNGAPVIEGQPA